MQVIVPGKPARFALRLTAYAPNGDRLGVLPQHLGFEVGLPLNDIPGLKVSYPVDGLKAELLAGHCEIAVEYSVNNSTWVEVPNGRFVRIKRGGDNTDRAGARSYDCPGWSWMLKKIVLYPGGTMVDGKRQFNAVSPGAILATFIQEGQARGALPGLTFDFTASRDSSGAAWATTMTLAIEPGKDLSAILINLAEQGVLDWRVEGRKLRVFNPGMVMGVNRASGPAPVDLRAGRDIIEAPDQGTLEDAASAVLIQGEAGLSVEVTNPAAVAPWGRWETYQKQGGVTDQGTARMLGQNALERVAVERVQVTRGLVFDTARWLPYLDYQVGDYLLAPGDSGVMQPLRLRQITLKLDDDGTLTGSVILNDRFLEREIKLARQAAGILAGGVAQGGSGTAPVPESGGRVPGVPQGLIVDPQAYLDEHGFATGQVTATWGAVREDVDGVALDIDSYELFMRRNVQGELWFLVATTVQGDTSATYSPLVVGWEYAFKVRAVCRGVKGEFSGQVAVLIPDDATPPPVPTPPVLSTRLGQIHVEWNGLGDGGVVMPSDFNRVQVWMQNPVSPGASMVGYLQAAGTVIVPGQPYGADREFWFTSVDHSGNESAASPSRVIATSPLVATDVIGEVISGSNIVDGSISAVDKVVANSITGGLIRGLSIQTGHLASNSVTTDKIAAGQIVASHISSSAIDGKVITGATIRTSSAVARLQLDSTGLRSYNSSGTELVTITNNGSFMMRSGTAGARMEIDLSGIRVFNSGGSKTFEVLAGSGDVDMVGRFTSTANSNAARLVINPLLGANPEIRFYRDATRYHYLTSHTTGDNFQIGTLTTDNRKTIIDMAPGRWAISRHDPGVTFREGGFITGEANLLQVGVENGASMTFWNNRALRLYGRWGYDSAEAGVVSFTIGLNNGNGWGVTFGVTLATVPGVSLTVDTGWDINGSYVRNRTASGVTVIASAGGPVSIYACMWIWQN